MGDYKKLILILRKEKLYYAFKRFVFAKLQLDYSSIELLIVRIMLDNKDNFLSVIQDTLGYSQETILSYILTSMNVTMIRREKIFKLFRNF